MSVAEDDVRRLARVLSAISHTLETSDGRVQRVERVLALACELVHARQCALLEANAGELVVYSSPPTGDGERAALRAKLAGLYRLVAGGDEIARAADARPSIALPVMGLDEIIGVIRVEPASGVFDARHLRLLAVVAAQLGAYLAMVRLRERDAAHVRELAAAHDFQQLLAGVVVHDLRNPLAVITAVAASLLASTQDPHHARALERALRNAHHATKLISDLVDVTASRVSGTMPISPERADLRAIVRATVDDLQHAHPTRTIELATTGAGPCDGEVDPLRLAQIVTNLVGNAILHGEASLPIRVYFAARADDVTIAVHNWGPPIPAALLPTIFDPFKQGAPTRRPADVRGLGLGLYIVDCLARGHGGTVAVTSDAETGTLFTVQLPRVVRAPAARDTAARTVLVVDDDEDIRLGAAGLLGARGYQVVTACDGRDALEQLRGGLRPHLILVDYNMPVMDGEAFCTACRDDPQLAEIPIVVVSADAAAAVKLAHTGARAFLRKPVSPELLLATIRETG